jgi:hypothetical protein
MKIKSIGSLAALTGLLVFSSPLLAHHGYAAYDMLSTRTMKGTVTYFAMVNPHGQIGIDTKGDGGEIQHWVMESGSAHGLKDQGFETDTFKSGDEVTLYFHPGKGDPHVGLFIKVVFPDGRILPKPKATE